MQPDDQNTIRGITLVPNPSRQYLNEKQELDYRSHRRDLIRWCLSKGKTPAKARGYSEDTIRVRAGHIDRFYRWCWDERGAYTTHVTHSDADAYMDHLAFKEPRHSTGTYLAHMSSLSSAQSQLRHKSPKTTMKYDNAPVEERRDALDKL